VINSFRKSFDTEEGQAIIVGALMMLILAFGLMVTLNLGTAVQEKIRLQNGSDAAAYSLAVTEAQAFNYIAFTNRVQAAHYNMIMTVQTYQVTMLLVESMLGTIYDFVAAIYGILFWLPFGIGSALEAIASAVGLVVDIFRFALYGKFGGGEPNSYGLMPFMGYAKQFIWYVNYAHYIANLIVGGMVWLKIASNMTPFVKQNDARIDASLGLSQVVNAVLNGYEYFSTFDKYAGGVPPFPSTMFNDAIESKKRNANDDDNKEDESPYDRPDDARARQKIMGEIANASRTSKFNLDRFHTFGPDLGILVLQFTTVGASKLLARSPRIEQNANQTDSFYNMMSSDGDSYDENDIKTGTIRQIRWNKEAHSNGSWGDIVASDKAYDFHVKLGFGSFLGFTIGIDKHFGMGTYLWSDNNGGNYWRWAAPADNPTGVCWQDLFGAGNANDACMDGQRSSLSDVTEGYIRIPVRLWDLFPGSLQTALKLALLITPFNSCKIHENNYKGKDWDSNTFGPDIRKAGPRCGHGPGYFKVFGKCMMGCCNGLPWLVCNYVIKLSMKKFRNHESVHHKKNAQQYYFGISPYIKFLPKSERLKDFNQPSTWMLLNLSATNFLEGKPWNFKQDNDILGTTGGSNGGTHGSTGSFSEHKRGTDAGDVPTRSFLSTNPIMPDGKPFSESKAFNILQPGVNVMSRARVYYHRPGNWNEHPNFFNPYWRAQLAPIAPKITSLLGRVLNLDNETQNNAGGGFFSNLGSIKSMLGNIFAEVLSKVITH
jgi:hypothetical protein